MVDDSEVFNLALNIIKFSRLLENVRVRRSGYAYRQLYAPFLHRYKMLTRCTWPTWHGPAREGVIELFTGLFITTDEFAMGVTKVFIRNPRTVRCFELILTF